MTERNADTIQVALGILDACERAARGFPAEYDNPIDKDARFIAGSVENWQRRIEVLKLQAAAGWKPLFQKVLDKAHSISIEEISYPQKEAVRTRKMRCMACGRWEKRCKYGLNAVGTFQNEEFNKKGASNLESAWNSFRTAYEETLSFSNKQKKLLDNDMGLYSIGETCMRKAQIYYQLNTLILNEVFEAYYKTIEHNSTRLEVDIEEWFIHATEDHAKSFSERFQQLQTCAADDKRCIPSWGTDETLWKKVHDQRNVASDGNSESLTRLLRTRAESHIGAIYECDDSSSDSETEISRSNHSRKTVRKRESTLEESDSDSGNLSDFIVNDDVEDEECKDEREAASCSKKNNPQRKTVNSSRKTPRVGARKSRRVMGKSPNLYCDALQDTEGPREEGVFSERIELSDTEAVNTSAHEAPEAPRACEPRHETSFDPPRDPLHEPASPFPQIWRAPPPDPLRVAQARRAPNGRLPARRESLMQLGELQLHLISKGLDEYASVCTNAIMTIQELMARVEQLAHTA